jgi:hypothetical protein
MKNIALLETLFGMNGVLSLSCVFGELNSGRE